MPGEVKGAVCKAGIFKLVTNFHFKGNNIVI